MKSPHNRTIGGNAAAIVLRYDPQLRLEYASPQALEIIPESLRASWEAVIGEVFSSGQPQELSVEIPCAGIFSLQLLPEAAADGAVHHVLAIALAVRRG